MMSKARGKRATGSIFLQNGKMKKNISMFFPAYNEEKNIPEIIEKATKVLRETAGKYEIIIVVYEGSTDNTTNIVKNYTKKDRHVRLILQSKDKKGVGYAKILGFKNAKYPYVFYADADLQFDLNDFKKFLPYIGEFDVIAGYRIKRQDPLSRILVSKCYNILMRLLFNVKERDLDCAFRLVNKNVIKNINLMCRTGVATTELLAKARKNGFRIKEIGVGHYPRKYGEPIFESKFLNIPKPKVVMEILREMNMLYKNLNLKDYKKSGKK